MRRLLLYDAGNFFDIYAIMLMKNKYFRMALICFIIFTLIINIKRIL